MVVKKHGANFFMVDALGFLRKLPYFLRFWKIGQFSQKYGPEIKTKIGTIIFDKS